MKLNFLILLVLLTLSSAAKSQCLILNSAGTPAPAQSDLLYRILQVQGPCPENVFQFRGVMTSEGAKFKTTMVGNRGFHNPVHGSFSIFESVIGNFQKIGMSLKPGDFFLGHFTAPAPNNTLTADQSPSQNSLMIELIAWDFAKGFYNFYELRGNGQKGIWFYRGDSADISADVAMLHRTGAPNFGRRLRCSGCHTGGGPIMKELALPHNDWWSKERPLPLSGRAPDMTLKPFFQNLSSGHELANDVMVGNMKLQASPGYMRVKSGQSLQEVLRPLFCPVEINFTSDILPLEAGSDVMQIPSAFLLDPHLATGQIKISKSLYLAALNQMGSKFPENGMFDADHGFLAPTKAFSDTLMINEMMKAGIIDSRLAFAILSLDKGNPALSQARCGLLKYVPSSGSSGWMQIFISAIKTSLEPAAKKLFSILNENNSVAQYKQKAQMFLNKCQMQASTPEGVTKFVALLFQRRFELKNSEISKNPLGQILEPGFRVIFPEVPHFPRGLSVDDNCQVI